MLRSPPPPTPPPPTSESHGCRLERSVCECSVPPPPSPLPWGEGENCVFLGSMREIVRGILSPCDGKRFGVREPSLRERSDLGHNASTLKRFISSRFNVLTFQRFNVLLDFKSSFTTITPW